MQSIEELTRESLLEQIASCTTSASISSGDERLASIRGFEALFKQLCRTPSIVRMLLHKEFDFKGQVDAMKIDPETEEELLNKPWFASTFVIPNYSRMVEWATKMIQEYERGRIVVAIIPARTNTKWFHDFVITRATELRFIKGRLVFPGFKNQSPFPDVLAVYDPRKKRMSIDKQELAQVDSCMGLDLNSRKTGNLTIITSVTGDTSSRITMDTCDSEGEEETGTKDNEADNKDEEEEMKQPRKSTRRRKPVSRK